MNKTVACSYLAADREYKHKNKECSVSLKWPPKDPDEKLGYSVDWSRFLGADTISSVAWFITDADGTKVAVDAGNTVNGLKFVIKSNTPLVSLAVLSGGTNNTTYLVTCQITFGTDSLVSERKIQLPIREK
tara:strand:- start:119 stop:511 length:393 start_codon:yes stop_codon:yes gene_type:complete